MKTKEPRTKMCTLHCDVVEASLQKLKCQNRHFESTSLRICRDDHLFRPVQSLVPLVVWIECSFPHASWAPWQLGGLVGPCLARTFAFSLPSLLRAPSCFAFPPTHANPTSLAVLSSPCYAPPGLFFPKGGHTSLLPSPPFLRSQCPLSAATTSHLVRSTGRQVRRHLHPTSSHVHKEVGKRTCVAG